ncbi:hypothetical protein OIU78_024067 [Salix suchowensis]|nr:hypothetical protein OIU78_024067 [Salix suchowensis]
MSAMGEEQICALKDIALALPFLVNPQLNWEISNFYSQIHGPVITYPLYYDNTLVRGCYIALEGHAYENLAK